MIFTHQQVALQMVPHARTLRKARMQVISMVTDGLSTQQIRKYLARWIQWWSGTVDEWRKDRLIQWFCKACLPITPAAHIAALLLRQFRESRTWTIDHYRDRDVLTSLKLAA